MSRGDEKEFRLRPRKPPIPRGEREPRAWAVAFKTIAHYARASSSVKRSNGFRGAGTQRAAIPRNQRCAIRVTYSRNAVRGQWRAHGRYIARESAATEPTAAGFDAQTSGIDMASRLESWQAARDQRMWKVIISPEFGERVDLARLTRDLMNRVEKDLAIPLEWVAVAHFNTEHPHVHVALRGIGRDGQEIRLPRDYVKSGIRSAAEDLCTRQLGHRTSLDAAEAERREVREKRFTSLDRVILRSAGPSAAEQHVQIMIPLVSRMPGEGELVWNRRQHLIARMEALEDMGLARSTGLGVWNLRLDFEAVLRAMKCAGDRQRVLAAHGVVVSDERLPIEVLDFQKTRSVEGRVLVHGEDEQSGRRYLMLEGVDARVHFIEYTTEMEEARARGELRTNAFARLRRVLIDEEPVVQVEDLGDSEALLKRPDHFENKVQQLLKNGFLPDEDGWGGWLGRYQSTLKQAAVDVQYPDKTHDEDRSRNRSRDR
jgi:type IV secretory pathway VirD2 relaxase